MLMYAGVWWCVYGAVLWCMVVHVEFLSTAVSFQQVPLLKRQTHAVSANVKYAWWMLLASKATLIVAIVLSTVLHIKLEQADRNLSPMVATYAARFVQTRNLYLLL
jgi:hypothetical protein